MIIRQATKELKTTEPICIVKDISSEKWYASKPFTREYSEMFDNEESLKESLSKKENKWFSLQEHIDMLIKSLVN